MEKVESRLPSPRMGGTRIPLDAIMDIIDWQVAFYDGDDKQALIAACNVIYDHLHKDDPEIEMMRRP